MKEETLRKRYMLEDLKKLQKKTDQSFQLMRRLQEASDSGIVQCISCRSWHHYKRVDCGHFIQRGHLGVRYDRRNNWPQCKRCNHHLHGNHAKYRENLVLKLGKETVEELELIKDSHTWPQRMSWREWCIEVLIESKNEIKRLGPKN